MKTYEFHQDGFTVSTDKSRIDLDLVHRFLSTESYWAEAIPRDVVERSIEHSIAFGVYDDTSQVGFARVITDFATFAWIGDVFIVREHRGKGLSKFLMQSIFSVDELQRLRRWHLVTRDAQKLYRQFGFSEVAQPERHMEISRRGIYKQLTGE